MKHLIIGNGVAGTTAASNIRKTDPAADIQIITEEVYPFYSRIRLPELLSGKTDESGLVIRKPEWYENNRIQLSLGMKATAVDPARKEVTASNGAVFSYDRLLLATGACCFVPPIPGTDKKGVFTLRGLDDARAIKSYAENEGRNVLLIGGGVLGLEAGHGLLKAGCAVTVVEVFPRLLPKQMDGEGSLILQKRMESLGFTFHLDSRIREITGRDKAEGLLLEDGTLISCGMIIISAGIRFNLDLPAKLGMTIDRGLVVNDRMETGLPAIYAAGDLIQHNGLCYGIWPAAEKQGEVAGTNMAGGNAEYHGTIMSNSLTVAGTDIFSAGNIDVEGKKEAIISRDHDALVYRKLVADNNVIVGAILLGDARDRRRIMKAMESKTDIGSIRKQLQTWDLSPL